MERLRAPPLPQGRPSENAGGDLQRISAPSRGSREGEGLLAGLLPEGHGVLTVDHESALRPRRLDPYQEDLVRTPVNPFWSSRAQQMVMRPPEDVEHSRRNDELGGMPGIVRARIDEYEGLRQQVLRQAEESFKKEVDRLRAGGLSHDGTSYRTASSGEGLGFQPPPPPPPPTSESQSEGTGCGSGSSLEENPCRRRHHRHRLRRLGPQKVMGEIEERVSTWPSPCETWNCLNSLRRQAKRRLSSLGIG